MNAHTRPPGEPQDTPLYIRTPVTPEEAFQAIGRLRKEARDEIDRLIRFLDETDYHMELEDSIDDNPHDGDELEPSLCGVTVAAGNMPNLGTDGDRELEEGNDEPSLGTIEASFVVYADTGCVMTQNFNQTAKQGGSLDLEDQHDDREPDVDDEPSLGGIEACTGGDDKDLEGDDADREPSLGWPERLGQAARPGGSDDRELSAEAGARVVRAARKRPAAHTRTDHSGRHVDIDDSVRIGTRKIRNLSATQENLLAPRIDRGEVRI